MNLKKKKMKLKRKSILVIMLAASLALAFSCKKEKEPEAPQATTTTTPVTPDKPTDETKELTVESATASVKENETATVAINTANGKVSVKAYSKENIAEATIADNTVSIKGLKEGETTITLQDEKKKTAKITVTVVKEEGTPPAAVEVAVTKKDGQPAEKDGEVYLVPAAEKDAIAIHVTGLTYKTPEEVAQNLTFTIGASTENKAETICAVTKSNAPKQGYDIAIDASAAKEDETAMLTIKTGSKDITLTFKRPKAATPPNSKVAKLEAKVKEAEKEVADAEDALERAKDEEAKAKKASDDQTVKRKEANRSSYKKLSELRKDIDNSNLEELIREASKKCKGLVGQNIDIKLTASLNGVMQSLRILNSALRAGTKDVYDTHYSKISAAVLAIKALTFFNSNAEVKAAVKAISAVTDKLSELYPKLEAYDKVYKEYQKAKNLEHKKYQEYKDARSRKSDAENAVTTAKQKLEKAKDELEKAKNEGK